MKISLAFLVEGISSLLVLATLTLFKSLQQSSKAQTQSTNQAKQHTQTKITKSKICMQACQALLCLQKWFLVGHRLLGTPNGHFCKVAKSCIGMQRLVLM